MEIIKSIITVLFVVFMLYIVVSSSKFHVETILKKIKVKK